MLLFKLWMFEFDFGSLFFLLMGIVLGILIAVLIYLGFVLATLRSKKYVVGSIIDISDEEVKTMIEQAQMVFKDKTLQGDLGTVTYARNVTVELVNDIARKFFPDSKHPIFELSIDEVLMLARYISTRIDKMIDRPALRILKKIKISTIIGLGDAKRSFDESALMKVTKKFKIKEIFNTVKGALNIVNPIYWVRKLIVNKSLNYAIYRICIMVIGIAGEETYKIYSKRVFQEEVVIDTGIESLAKDLDQEVMKMNED